MPLTVMKTVWGRLRPPRKPALREAFFARYAGCSLLVHAGFPEQWLGKLVHEPGGGGHFRIDTRQPAYSAPRLPRRPLGVHWVIRSHILPLGLPLPLLVRANVDHSLLVRHLQRHGGICDPAEVGPLYEDMLARPHYCLRPAADGGFTAEAVLSPDENTMETPYGLI